MTAVAVLAAVTTAVVAATAEVAGWVEVPLAVSRVAGTAAAWEAARVVEAGLAARAAATAAMAAMAAWAAANVVRTPAPQPASDSAQAQSDGWSRIYRHGRRPP